MRGWTQARLGAKEGSDVETKANLEDSRERKSGFIWHWTVFEN